MTAVSGGVRVLLRLEGLAVLILSVAGYGLCAAHGWGFFAVLFLLPDVSMAGYLAGPRLGARIYNAVHTYLGPAALLSFGVWSDNVLSIDVALIWAAHIGMDRCVGYGLKYSTAFGDTHLGRVGRRPANPRSSISGSSDGSSI